MSFWSDSSALVKGAIVVGVIGMVVLGMVWAGVGPFSTDRDSADVTEQRGI